MDFWVEAAAVAVQGEAEPDRPCGAAANQTALMGDAVKEVRA